MQVDITGRQIEVTPALRDFAEDKLRKLTKLLDGPLEAHVVLAIEKHRHVAEIQVKSRHGIFSGTCESGDLYASIGDVTEKLERQAKKHKEKMRNHKHQSPRHPDIAAAIGANAAAEVTGTGNDVDPRPRIVSSRAFRAKPLTPEDAVLDLEATGDDLLVYRDADTDKIQVLFRRRDGHLELVQPES